MSSEQDPDCTRTAGLNNQLVLWIVPNVVRVFFWSFFGSPCAIAENMIKFKSINLKWKSLYDNRTVTMYNNVGSVSFHYLVRNGHLLVHAGCVLKQIRVPVDVDDIIELKNRLIVYPEDAIVTHAGTLGVKAKCRSHLWRPVLCVQL